MQGPLSRFLGLVGIISLAFVTSPSRAQDKFEKVKFTTVDGVDIIGQFYPGKGSAPVALLLHAYESNSRTKDWTNLALGLQKAGYAVLAFDFRGHGDSTNIDPALFWNFPPNRNYVRVKDRTDTKIDVKSFQPAYRTTLINDIAAAKAFLDRKNDTRACNSGATILIGAEDGANLGAIWLNSEMKRYKMVPNMFMGLVLNNQPEGKDICACLFLSPTNKIGNYPFSFKGTVYTPGKGAEIPMVFFHGELDTEGKKLAKTTETYLKDNKTSKEKLQYTGAFEIKGTKLTGTKLLQAGSTIGAVTDWLDQVVPLKAKEWEERDFRKTQYYWSPIPGKLIPAKVLPTDMNMAFDTYMSYMVR